jgi:hypothetical protein
MCNTTARLVGVGRKRRTTSEQPRNLEICWNEEYDRQVGVVWMGFYESRSSPFGTRDLRYLLRPKLGRNLVASHDNLFLSSLTENHETQSGGINPNSPFHENGVAFEVPADMLSNLF